MELGLYQTVSKGEFIYGKHKVGDKQKYIH